MQKKKGAYPYRPFQLRKNLDAEGDIERFYQHVRQALPYEQLCKITAINVMILLVVVGGFFLGSLLLEKPTFSAIEKRELATFPCFSAKALLQGKWTRDVETWFADTFPLRDAFVSLSAVTEEARGIRVDDVRIIQAPKTQHEAQGLESQQPTFQPNPSTKPPVLETGSSEDAKQEEPAPAIKPDSDPNAAPSAIENGTFVYKGRAMTLFGTGKSLGAQYAQVLNAYHQELPDVQIYNLLIPTAIEFYVPEKYSDLSASQKEMIDYIYSVEDPAIKKVDAHSELARHAQEYLYFRTDHHWTGLGAYYAYTAFCKQAGIEPAKLESFETRRLDNFIGTMYAQTQDSTLLENPDYVDYYIFPGNYTVERYDRGMPFTPIPHSLWGEYAVSPNSYSVFLHGDFPLIKIKTDLKNGKKILVVKESFGNAFAPFLVNNYEEVYVVDQRYFQLSLVDFIKQNGIGELVFANNIFAACTPYHIRLIDGLRHQIFPPPVQAAPSEPIIQESTSSTAEATSSAPENTEKKPRQRKRVHTVSSSKESSP